jgi:hypothetical protein
MARDIENHAARCVALRSAVRQHALDELELGDRLPELFRVIAARLS